MWWTLLVVGVLLLIGSTLVKRRLTRLDEKQPPPDRQKPGAGRKYPVIREPKPPMPGADRRHPVIRPSDKPDIVGSGYLYPAARAVADKPALAEPPKPPPVSEQISVVLRRQVPVRDEPARSWIGGLPMMPDDVEWPTGPTIDYPQRGNTPLHFVAQIACADLPAELWGGLGPRSGWLLLFLNGQDWNVEDDSQAIRVLHISELGPERAPPPSIFPVHDEMYSGPNYGFVRSQEDIPVSWRRWPVDLVPIPNRTIGGKRHPTIIPENFASILYDGAPIADGRADPSATAPFTWRGALYVVDSIARVLAKEHQPRLDGLRDKVSAPGWMAEAIGRVDAEIARWADSPAMRDAGAALDDAARSRLETARANISKRRLELQQVRQLLVESQDPATLLERIEQTHWDYANWRQSAQRRVDALRQGIVSRELDTVLTGSDWERLRAALEEDRQAYWFLQQSSSTGLLPARIDQSVLDYARDGLHAARVELAADYYVSPKLRHLAPADLIAFMGPHWRSLYDNRPHRMGGMHDGVQSDATEGPTGSVLLFQIATDDAMHWVWGDAGAYYVFIDTDRLAAGDFSKLDCSFECH